MSSTIWLNLCLIILSTPHTTHTSQVKTHSHCTPMIFFNINTSKVYNFWILIHPSTCLSVFSGSVDRSIFSGDVQTGAVDRLSLCRAGLLEGPTARWRALHHTRVHHDHWDTFQGVFGRPYGYSFSLSVSRQSLLQNQIHIMMSLELPFRRAPFNCVTLHNVCRRWLKQ